MPRWPRASPNAHATACRTRLPHVLRSPRAVALPLLFLALRRASAPVPVALALSSPSPDRVLPPEYYQSVYKGIPPTTTSGEGAPAGGATPWDIGRRRPQPAVVRAYEAGGLLRGRVLDAGCGAGENAVYLGHRLGVRSVTGFDLSEDAVRLADAVAGEEEETPHWTRPRFVQASCTDVADARGAELLAGNGGERFDAALDSGLLHCLSPEDASAYVAQIARLLKPGTGTFSIGCFSTANPDPWDNPRRISEAYLRDELFADRATWEVLSCRECWWARPPSRGSQRGAFSLALWVEVRRVAASESGEEG